MYGMNRFLVLVSLLPHLVEKDLKYGAGWNCRRKVRDLVRWREDNADAGEDENENEEEA